MSSNKPFPSSDLDVFKENSLILDNFVNSQENEHPDRFGRKRPTITGIIKEAFNVRTDISNMNETLIGQSRWDDVPKNTSLSLGGDNGALNKQAQSLFNRSEMLKVLSREALRRTYLEVGYNLVEGSFEQGGTLQSATDVLLEEKTGKVYSWSGSFPEGGKVIPKNSKPISGTVEDTDWVEVYQNNLRDSLSSDRGIDLINDGSRKTIFLTDKKWGLNDSPTADNTLQLSQILQNVENNTVIDFGGMSLRVLSTVPGVLASSATPSVTNALPKNQCLCLDGKKGIKFINGTVYAGNAGKSETKKYFPSTISFINCEDLEFDNFWAEGKGESWGSADSSISETKDRRLEFSVTNGGHAAFFGRCKGVRGNINGRLCGSTAVLYFSSCTGVKLDRPFANCASLGYNPICFDGWVGSIEEVGVSDFLALVVNPILRKETLFRREDGVTPVGSSVYAGKGGILTEDFGVQCFSLGGDISDMYSNGSNERLGYAFGAGSGSINHNIGARVRVCQEVIFANWSTDNKSTCIALDVDALVGLCGVMIDKQPYGTGYMKLTGTVVINKTRVFPSSPDIDLRGTSLICNLKPTSYVDVDVDCLCPPEGVVETMISNKAVASYGAVKILGGEYHLGGFVIDSVGWGGASDSMDTGIFAIGKCKIYDRSGITVYPFIRYQNKSDHNVFTYVNHDLTNVTFIGNSFRPLDGYTFFGTNLVRKVALPPPQGRLYLTGTTRTHSRDTVMGTQLTCVSVDGLAGTNTNITFRVGNNTPLLSNARILNGPNMHRVIGANTSFIDRPDDSVSNYRHGIARQYTIEGDVRTLYTPGTTYTVIGA